VFSLVKNQRGYELRVHDDAFSVMCHAINDLDTMVRTEAAALLRRFELVSEHFLHQTLDKKLLAPMKVKLIFGL
jgi:integrator complex subunit 4